MIETLGKELDEVGVADCRGDYVVFSKVGKELGLVK